MDQDASLTGPEGGLQDPGVTEAPTTPEAEDLGGPGAGPSEAAAGADEDAALTAMAAADPAAAAELQAEWDGDFGGNLELARQGARAVATPDLVALLEDSGLGDHPALIRAAAEIGRRLETEADLPDEPAPEAPAAAELERLDAEIDRLHGLQASQPQAYRSERTQRALARLYARRYGRGPLVGEGQRRL